MNNIRWKFCLIFYYSFFASQTVYSDEFIIGVFRVNNKMVYTLSGDIVEENVLSDTITKFIRMGVFPENPITILLHKEITVEEIIKVFTFLNENNITNYIVSFDHVLKVRASFMEHDPEAKIFLENNVNGDP